MISVEQFVSTLVGQGVGFFCGVPDSLLKNFCAYITDNSVEKVGGESRSTKDDKTPLSTSTSSLLSHIIAANEGGAVALASGHYLATGKPALVYMQNSGQGNAVNPLASLADPDVYSIPMILLVGWRGEPGVHDEPQHVKQGKITVSLFETMGIPAYVIPDEVGTDVSAARGMPGGHPLPDWRTVVENACKQAMDEKRPVALIVRKGLFADYKLQSKKPDIADLPREKAIEQLLDTLPPDAVIVSTTGMISRELYELREKVGGESRSTADSLLSEKHSRDFLTVGSMGHASMIAMGIAQAQPKRPVICLDGDGASIMQMGNMAIVGQSGCANLTHIVLNNAAHDSVGGQPTVGGSIDLKAIAKACGYEVVEKVGGESRSTKDRPLFVEIKVAKGARKDLGRPKEPPQVNKQLFMSTLNPQH